MLVPLIFLPVCATFPDNCTTLGLYDDIFFYLHYKIYFFFITNLGEWQHITVAVKYLKILQNQSQMTAEKKQQIISGYNIFHHN